MTKSNNMTNLLDQLKIQVLLYSGTLIEYQTDTAALERLLATAAALKRNRVDVLLWSVEAEARLCGCSASLSKSYPFNGDE